MLAEGLSKFLRKGKLNQHAFGAMFNEEALYDPEVFSQLLSPLKTREISIELRAVLIADSDGPCACLRWTMRLSPAKERQVRVRPVRASIERARDVLPHGRIRPQPYRF